MSFELYWEKALKKTEILRARIQPLSTYSATHLPYVFLAESSVNLGDTVVRSGEVVVEKPAIILPRDNPQFEGFDSDDISFKSNLITDFLFMRGIRFPSMKYNNKTHSLEVCEGKLQSSIDTYLAKLQREENTATGLLMGPEDCWQFSVLIFVCSQILRSADGDIQKLLDEYKKED